jgi:hypothetical protein
MTLYPFKRLDELEQLEVLWDNGVVVAEREEEIIRYKLYHVASFYVEEEFHKEYKVRRPFYSFASTNAEKVRPYLENIDISKIK